MEKLLEEIIKVTKEAGTILTDAVDIEKTIEAKEGRANFVTAFDKKVQDFLFEKLGEILPEAVFIGEEEKDHKELPEGYAFVIDPIDGTTNFMKGFCASSISVGLLKAGQPEMGVVYNPYLNEMYSAQRGKGAFCNGRRIHVSEHGLQDGLVLFGTAPYNEELAKKSFACAYGLFMRSMDVRRSGSAAIDLCNVACGRAELYFEMLLSPWDYAAGALILTEAGGCITDLKGNPVSFGEKSGVAAGNSKTAVDVFLEIQKRNGSEA